jgi:transglutaminase-like putative cysteine protease
MRSSVVDTGRAPKVAAPDKNSIPPSQPRVSFQQPTPPSPKKPVRRPLEVSLKVITPEEGWLALALLAIALYCVVFSVIAAKWVDQSQALLYTPLVGLLVGLGIAKVPRLPQAILHLAACLLGYWFSVLLTSFVAFHASWLLLLGGLRATLTGNITSLTPAQSMMVFFFYLSFLCFFLGYFGSWLVYRARLPWLVTLVYSSIILVNLNYLDMNDNRRYLVVLMLGALLLLIARVHLVSQIAGWKLEGLHTDSTWMRTLTARFMRVAILLTLITMLVSILLPVQQQSISGKNLWDRLDGFWNNLAGGRLADLSPSSLFPSGEPTANFFSDHLTISGNVQLPTGEVLYYTGGTSHYLQGFVYNSFDGHTWKSAPATLQNQFFAAHQMLPVEETNAPFTQVSTNVTIEQPPGGTKNYIFAPAQPASFNVDVVLYSLQNVTDAWTQASPLQKGKSYIVNSDISSATPEMLAQTPLPHDNAGFWHQSQNYQAVSAVDLQLPNDLSPTVYDLARQWTAGTTDTYAALRSLESHLSDTNVFTYSTNNPAIPANQDVADYLLKNRRGYCTHYATTMIMLARILNIPTRMVNGFSRGHYDVTRKVWSVEGSDAHSWVQAYFPNYGWIDFDPTPGYSLHAANTTPQSKPTAVPTKTTPNKVQPIPTASPTKATPPTTTNKTSHPLNRPSKPNNGVNQTVLMWLAVFILLCSFFAFLFALCVRWWRNLYSNSSFVSGTFWRLCRLAGWVGLAPKGWQTPYEYSGMLSQHLSDGSKPLWHLTTLFVRDRWGPPHVAPHPQEEEAVEQFWPILRTAVLEQVVHRFKKTS